MHSIKKMTALFFAVIIITSIAALNVSAEDDSSSFVSSEQTFPSQPATETEPVAETTPVKPVSAKSPALNAVKKALKAGDVYTVKVKNTTAKATFSSNKKTVAAVSPSGKVTALRKGTAVITVKVARKKLTCKIVVSTNPTAKVGKKALKSSYTLKRGATMTITVTGKAAAIKNIYKSDNAKIAKVVSKTSESTIKIKASAKGTANITITVNKVRTFPVKLQVK